MSEEHVELARQYYEAWNAQGQRATEHWRNSAIEFYDPPNFPDADRHIGEAAFRERIESFIEVGWDGQCRVQEYLDAGDEVVVAWRAMGRSPHGGGLPVDLTIVHVVLFEDGKIRRIRSYLSREQALEAAGLSE
jgi:ketosteroid isomerase-like protein